MKNEWHEASHCHKKGDEPEPAKALVVMESASYRQFSHSIDKQLARLVERWVHTAAPCAMRNPGARISHKALKPSKPK